MLVNKQHYLKRDKLETNDPEVEVWEYSWGERAKLEVKESDVLKMVCELYDCEPRMFKEQYDKVTTVNPDLQDNGKNLIVVQVVEAEGEEVMAAE